MHIYVKNIVSHCCKMIVNSELTKPGIDHMAVNLGEKLLYDYTCRANLFSEVKGMTIDKFYLYHTI